MEKVERLQKSVQKHFPIGYSRIKSANIIVPSHLADHQQFLKKVLSHPKTKKLASYFIDEVQGHLKEVKNEWEAQWSLSNAIMARVLGFKVEKQLTLHILSPSLSEAFSAIGEKTSNFMAYGSPQFFPNHSVITIWHEILHSYLDKKTEDNPIEHSIIELATNYTLNFCLKELNFSPIDISACWKDNQHYFQWGMLTENIPTHTSLTPIRQNIVEGLHWWNYLNNPEMNILDFAKEMSRIAD